MCGLKAAQKYLGDVLGAHILTVGVYNVGIYIDGGGGVGYVVMVMVALVMWW